MKRTYEVLLILDPQAEEETALNRIETMLEKLDGHVVKRNKMGNRELSYPINKKSRARYWNLVIELLPNKVKEFQTLAKLEDMILRMTVYIYENKKEEETSTVNDR